MRKSAACIVTLLLFTVTNSTHAQVYRCERDGNISFSDKECEVGAKESKKDYAAAANGALDMDIKLVYYDVLGKDYASLRQSMIARGPNGHTGMAGWGVNYKYESKKSRDGCQITFVRIKVSGVIVMPRWVDEPSAPLELQRWWSNSYATLKRHEDGHIQHGRELALLVKERLMGMGVIPCDQLKALAQDEYQRIYDNLKRRDQEYDRRTDHGRNQ